MSRLRCWVWRGYVLLLTLAMLRLGSENACLDRRLHGLIALLSLGGAGYSWFLQWIAHAEIGAFCIWCRSSAIVMSLLFCTAAAEGWAGHQHRLRPQKTEKTNAEKQEIHGWTAHAPNSEEFVSTRKKSGPEGRKRRCW